METHEKQIAKLTSENHDLLKLVKSLRRDIDKMRDDFIGPIQFESKFKKQSGHVNRVLRPEKFRKIGTVAVQIMRLQVMGGGYRASPVTVLLREYKGQMNVMTAINSNGWKTSLTNEERITALCLVDREGWHFPKTKRKKETGRVRSDK